MKKNILFALFFFLNLNLILNLVSCSTTDPKLEPDLKLELKDVSCTEAWLQLTTNNIQLPATINLLKNNSVTQTFSLSTNDSLLYIDSLLPNQTYKLIAAMQQSNNISNEVTITTMDTSSHNFTWQTFTFGEHSSSTLYDVAIIDENNIWAVGEIYMNDSLGDPDPTCYNCVHWDGQQWELKRIKTNACGGVNYPPIRAIFALSTDDVLFAHIDGSITHFNGIEFTNDCSLITQLNGSANKIWSVSKNDFYVVSVNGFIAHYQNGSWSKIESGTMLHIQDIWGSKDQTSGEVQVLCIASNKFQNQGKKLLKIESNTTSELPDADLSWSLSGIWFKANRKYYIVGDGIYPNTTLNNIWQRFIGLPLIYKNSIRGDNYNNIAVCGAFGLLSYFNGYTWQSYGGNELPSFSGGYLSVAVSNNNIIAAGYNSSRAVIALGKR